MISIQEFLKTVEYRISEGYEFQWRCYGTDAWGLVSEAENYYATIIFDTKTRVVYELSIANDDVEYRRINPSYAKEYSKEVAERNITEEPNVVFLETDLDFIEKMVAIINDEPYDTRVQLPIDLTDEEWFDIMKRAHEADMTLNQFIEKLIMGVINDAERVDRSTS